MNTALFQAATWPLLIDWIHGVEGWSTAMRRSVWAWKRVHGFRHVSRMIDGKKHRVWLHPKKHLLPNYLGGQVVVIDKVTRSAD